MTVKELYRLCSNWLPDTRVSVHLGFTGTHEVFTNYRKVIELYGDKSVLNFCWFPCGSEIPARMKDAEVFVATPLNISFSSVKHWNIVLL